MLNNLVAVLDSGVAAAVGDYESIQTVTVGAGGSSTISFTSIPSTYKHLQLRVLNQWSANDRSALIRFNSDSGSNYSYHWLTGDGSSATASAGTSATVIEYMYNFGSGYSSSYFGASVLDILDYANTNKYKTTRALSGFDYNGSGRVQFQSGSWRNSGSAISSITITTQSGTFLEKSSFALYGIK
jgi:hypothetical protein